MGDQLGQQRIQLRQPRGQPRETERELAGTGDQLEALVDRFEECGGIGLSVGSEGETERRGIAGDRRRRGLQTVDHRVELLLPLREILDGLFIGNLKRQVYKR